MSNKVAVRRVVERTESGSGAPILLNFEHAAVNKHINVGSRLIGKLYESDSRSSYELSTPESMSERQEKQVVIVQGETDMTYIGSSDSLLNSNPTGLRTFLCVRHKKKLKVYEALPMTVSPHVSDRAHLRVMDSSKPHDAEKKRKVANELVKAFGSKKKRLSYERSERNKIDSEHMNESINAAAENAAVPVTPPPAASIKRRYSNKKVK